MLEKMNILIDTAYLMFIFWFGSRAAFDDIYKLDIKNDLEICTIVRNKKGKAAIRLNGLFLTIGNTFFFPYFSSLRSHRTSDSKCSLRTTEWDVPHEP